MLDIQYLWSGAFAPPGLLHPGAQPNPLPCPTYYATAWTYVFSCIFAEILLDVHSTDSDAHVEVDEVDARSPTRHFLTGSRQSLHSRRSNISIKGVTNWCIGVSAHRPLLAFKT